MLNSEQFATLNQHLNSICHTVPYKWGKVQIKDYERKLPKLFEYQDYNDLNEAINRNIERGLIPNNEEHIGYYQHRWFTYYCSVIDQFLFNSQASKHNLDLTGVVILTGHDYAEYVLNKPLVLIDALYKQEARDFMYRRKLRNRLFVACHSFAGIEREPLLQSAFDIKSEIFEEYAKLLTRSGHKLFDYFNIRTADIIFLIERNDGTLEYGFGSENPKGSIMFKQISTKLI